MSFLQMYRIDNIITSRTLTHPPWSHDIHFGERSIWSSCITNYYAQLFRWLLFVYQKQSNRLFYRLHFDFLSFLCLVNLLLFLFIYYSFGMCYLNHWRRPNQSTDGVLVFISDQFQTSLYENFHIFLKLSITDCHN